MRIAASPQGAITPACFSARDSFRRLSDAGPERGACGDGFRRRACYNRCVMFSFPPAARLLRFLREMIRGASEYVFPGRALYSAADSVPRKAIKLLLYYTGLILFEAGFYLMAAGALSLTAGGLVWLFDTDLFSDFLKSYTYYEYFKPVYALYAVAAGVASWFCCFGTGLAFEAMFPAGSGE